jgi:sugar phosphate isomerase/epimerase
MADFGPLLLHSVSYAGFWGQAALSLEEFLDKAASLGYDGVMLMAKRPHLSVLDYGPEACARLRERLERLNLKAVCIAGYNNFTADLEHGDIPHREFQIQHVTRLAELANALGGKLVRVFTGYESSAAPLATQWRMVVEALRECARRASKYNVVIGVQNHHDIGAGWEQMQDLIQAVNEPNCRAMFDAWAPFLQGADLKEAARAMGPITVHTTVADYRLLPRYHYNASVVNYSRDTPLVQAVPMGEGAVDYRNFFAALAEAGFRGSVAYEMCSPLRDGGSMETLDEYGRRFVEFMKAL